MNYLNRIGKRRALLVLILAVAVILGILILRRKDSTPLSPSNNTEQSQINKTPNPTNTEFNPVTPSPTASAKAWKWELSGCGSHAPCVYKVCSTTDKSKCYNCTYVSGVEGGFVPEQSDINPETTKQFSCKHA